MDCHAFLQRNFPTQGSNPESLIALVFFTTNATWEAPFGKSGGVKDFILKET